ncbi:MAG: ATP-dependent DNA ligase [Bacteroidetes bacterium]|nr:ATP-dependent DNA ligase [Bacteroidota bacterium]MCL5025163.1 ATP-dependent DNA ligase [Chloroflexota bacterium]
MQFAQLTQFFEELEKTSSRKSLVQILARLFAAADANEVSKLAYLCQGRLVPFFEPLEIGMGEKMVAEALANAYGKPRQDVLRRFGELGDLGLVAAELAGQTTIEPDTLSVDDVYDALYAIATTAGSGSVESKVGRLAELLRHLDPLSAKHLVRIPLGRLRLGIGDPTVLDALSFARVGDTSLRKQLERAYNLTSDLGYIAHVFWQEGIEAVQHIGVVLGKPIRPALAERLPSAEAIIAKMGRCAAEPKYDGFRCQVHKMGGDIRVFSRNLENMTDMFPEIVGAARTQIHAETAIVEGEAVAYNAESEEFYPFQETTRRRRKHDIDRMAEELPLRLFVFDLMYVNGEDYTHCTYIERREKIAEILVEDTVLAVSPSIATDSAKVLNDYFLDNIQKGLEGIVAKRPDTIYQAGARNFNWVKLKRSSGGELQDTVDCVILGYIYGRGKRATFGAGALLTGVYDPEKDEFVTVTKIGTGLTDEEWRSIRELCTPVPERPARVNSLIVPSVWVEPTVVIEVLADEITRSPIHTAGKGGDQPGYALRFPRLVSFRGADKRPEDATTVAEIIEMYEAQRKKLVT